MDITTNRRTLILNALRAKKVSKTTLADQMGYGKAWVTKLLNGTLKSVSDDAADRLESLLGIQFIEAVRQDVRVSGLAVEVTAAIEKCPQLARVLAELLPLAETPKMTPRYFETAELVGLGKEIIRLVFANEDKPGKVAREVLRLVSEN